MPSTRPHLPDRAPLVYAAGLLVSACLLAACDRHSATEAPESYGHGSSHRLNYTGHEIDSRKDSRSFSDTQGVEAGAAETPAAAQSGATPAGTAASGHFFPGGN